MECQKQSKIGYEYIFHRGMCRNLINCISQDQLENQLSDERDASIFLPSSTDHSKLQEHGNLIIYLMLS